MRVLVPGATGLVGGHVVEQALARGHDVVAVARDAARLDVDHPRLRKCSVDILDEAAVEPLLVGVDAVVSTVGIGTARTPTTLYSAGTRHLVQGMARHGVERIVVISSEVAEHWAHQGPLKLWIVLPLLQKVLGATYDDMRRMDVVLWESRAQWTGVRAPRIRRTSASGRYRLGDGAPLRRGWSIAAADLATALLDVAERDDLGRRHVHVAS
ncbi:NAD(P)-dependent oxidoreductase [Oerskovia sp. KBS0722]|uniref:NAD(P)-dependent oxidoreductase n=1 Tax=Oerskovia sp. KBS0722 TaxID=1179673 RepID=UPI00110F3541|nr:NAD(P)H-binding protein [Oerskovia sp. KBS0722]QDW63343.1 NAD-dependent epimerase/dehydratase family protein [Oerskovia sp. KBS0722]